MHGVDNEQGTKDERAVKEFEFDQGHELVFKPPKEPIQQKLFPGFRSQMINSQLRASEDQ